MRLWLPVERRPAESAWSSVGGKSGEALSPPPRPARPEFGKQGGRGGTQHSGSGLRSSLRRGGGGAEARERAELALLTAVRDHGG